MKKKFFIKLAIVITIVFAVSIWLTFYLTDGFTVGRITGRVYNVQNVYDEIWNLVKTEAKGTKTVLSTSTPNAKTFFDYGSYFNSVYIPECKVYLYFHYNYLGDCLRITIHTGELYIDETFGSTREKILFHCYNPQTKTLLLDDNDDFLLSHFLSEYFKWRDSDKSKSDYSIDDLGTYTLQQDI